MLLIPIFQPASKLKAIFSPSKLLKLLPPTDNTPH